MFMGCQSSRIGNLEKSEETAAKPNCEPHTIFTMQSENLTVKGALVCLNRIFNFLATRLVFFHSISLGLLWL